MAPRRSSPSRVHSPTVRDLIDRIIDRLRTTDRRLLIAVAAAVVLIVVVAVAAFAGGSEEAAPPETTTTTAAPTTTSSSTTTTSTTTTTTTVPGTPAPLNGLPVEDETLLERRVVAVKIDNHPNARPQSGIQEADAVYEMLVEGGLTRFIALFHQSDSGYLGPIRSGRPTDPTLLRYLGAVFQISGAQDWVTSRIVGAGVSLLGEGSSTFRTSNRSAPHNLYGATESMRELSDSRQYANDPPQAMFEFGPEPTEPTEEATEITLDWSADWASVVWQWDGERYLRFLGDSPSRWIDIEGGQEQIAADTLVVLEAAAYTASPPQGVAGQAVPAFETVGTNTAYVFHDGGVVEATWTRTSIEERFELTLDDGTSVVLPPGKPWISVFPAGRPITWSAP